MSVASEVVVCVVTMPLNVALWAAVASLPLRLGLQGKSLAIASLVTSFVILTSIILFKSGLAVELRVAGMISLPLATIICYFAWLGRQQRISENAHS